MPRSRVDLCRNRCGSLCFSQPEAGGRSRNGREARCRRAPGAAECQRVHYTRRRATIAAKITGRVTGVFFDEGTRVARASCWPPSMIPTLSAPRFRQADRDAAQAAIADYEVQLKNAQIALHRAEQLQQAGVQTQEALDNATTTRTA